MYICLTTFIEAPPQVCFDLARDIDLHQQSMQNTGERAVAGVTSGLIGLGDFVTWEAKHFGIKMHLSSKITAFSYPEMFVDEQLTGPFKYIRHRHLFRAFKNGTLMTDEFDCASPFGILGRFVDWLLMKRYLTKLLKHRNHIIKIAAGQSGT